MAFLPLAPLPARAHRRAHRRAPHRRAPHRRAPHCCAPPRPAATNHPQTVPAVAHPATDALIADVARHLDAAAPVPPALLPAIITHLSDTRGMARLALVESLGRIGGPAVPPLIAALSSHPDPVVRRSSGKALAKIGDPRATDALLHALVRDPDTVTRSSAAGALARMGPAAVPKLLALISDPCVPMTAKGHAAWAVAFMQHASDALLTGLRHPVVDVRVAVVSALGAVALGDALPAMRGADADDWADPDDRTADVRRRAVDALSAALDDHDPGVRAEAATALANARCAPEAPRIAEMLRDDDVELRRCAALALMKMGDVSFVDALREREADAAEDAGVRSVAKLAADTLERGAEEEDDDDWE